MKSPFRAHESSRARLSPALGSRSLSPIGGKLRDYVKAMWLLLQQEQPDDFVIASGQPLAVREMYEIVFRVPGVYAAGHVVISEKHFRPVETNDLPGDSWQPRSGEMP